MISELSPEVLEALEKAREGINLALEKLKIRETLGNLQKSLAPTLEKLKIEETLGNVQKSLISALEKVRESSAPVLDQMKTLVAKATDEIEALSQKVNVGEKTLADYLFAARRKVRQTGPGPGPGISSDLVDHYLLLPGEDGRWKRERTRKTTEIEEGTGGQSQG